jgi:hypothetical protein
MVGISTLWLRYPKTNYPCSTNNRRNFENQCAIRLGACLQNSGIDTDKLKVEKCWHHPTKEGHTLRARDLARALSRGIVSGVGKKEEYENGIEGLTRIWGRRGIVYFKDFWEERPGSREGDHIDLWQMRRCKSFELPQVPAYQPGLAGDYEKGSIWFWPVL